MIEIRSFYDLYVGWGNYTSNELTTPQYCRNYVQDTDIYKYSVGWTPWWLRPPWWPSWPPTRVFDIEIHSIGYCTGGDTDTVWLVRIVDKPLRLCTDWWTRNTTGGQVIQGKDVFWPVPEGSLWKKAPYQWARGSAVKSRSWCPAPNVAIPRAPKNYPVWPPIPDPGPVWR